MKNLIITVTLFTGFYAVSAQTKTTLTAFLENNTNTAKLQWQNIIDADSYHLQRSNDNKSFTDIFVLKADDFTKGDFIKYNDYKPLTGKTYFRLKIYKHNHTVETLPSIKVESPSTENLWNVYPVPMGSVLNLQYKGDKAIDGVITVFIQSVTSGTIFTRLRLASTTTKITIPISNIGKGTYDIKIYISNNIVWNNRVIKY